MKWLVRGVLIVVVLFLVAGVVLIGLGFASLQTPPRPVGFQETSFPGPDGKPLQVAIWYPTDSAPTPSVMGLTLQSVATGGRVAGRNLPLVLISHGNGGGPGSHTDTSLALAAAGFVVVAPLHRGDNYDDQSLVGTPEWLTSRAASVPATVDFMLKAWPGHDRIDPLRIGIFGFSAGGFTALAAIGGEPDLSVVDAHCKATPEFVCTLWKKGQTGFPRPQDFAHDPRIKAAVIAAPGLGFTFTPNGLSKVAAPVQLWAGDADQGVPYATNTGPVRQALGAKVEFHAVPRAAHFSFLTPCGPIGPPYLCRDGAGFDRKAFHQQFDAAVVRFFQTNSAAPAR